MPQLLLGHFCIYLSINRLRRVKLWAKETPTLGQGNSDFPATFLPETRHLSSRKDKGREFCKTISPFRSIYSAVYYGHANDGNTFHLTG